jgi:cytoskeleton protein RodZ
MAGLGAYLSHLREEHGPSIEELARVTRVAHRFIEALEREDFNALPAPVFTKGYIRAYCQALGVPADEALERYRDSTRIPAPTAPVPVSTAVSSSDDGRRTRGTLLLSFALLVGFGVALFAVTLFLQSGRPEIGARPAPPPAPSVKPEVKTAAAVPSPEPAKSPEPTPTPEASAPAAPPSPAPSASAPPPVVAPAPAGPTPAPPPGAAPVIRPPEAKAADTSRTAIAVDPPPLHLTAVVSPYRLVARTVESTWLRVRTDDGRATEETIPAGEVREWISNRPFVVTVGNAAGITLELNGQKLPPLGARGAVISRLILPPTEP